MPIHRVDAWSNFKSLVLTLKPDIIYYLAEPHPLKKPPLGLRLTFYQGGDMYVFIDFADCETLHKTGVRIVNPLDNILAEVREEDVKNFLSTQLGKVKLVSLPPFMY